VGRRFFQVLLLFFTPFALAQSYPSKPIHLIVPFPPGGPTDIVGRLVAQKISEGVGQPVVVENRAGAGGTVGSIAAAKSPADGYNLLYGSTSTLAIAPSLYRNLPYDPRKAFAPISLVSRGPILVVVNAQVPARTLKEFIDLAKKQPGKLSYSSAGSGTPPHLAGELFKAVAGVDLLHVPYKGGAPAINDVVGGQVQAVFEGQVALLPHLQSRRLRALAISGTARSPALPDVPTAVEAGLPKYDANFWSGLVAPAGTPAEAINRLNAVLVKALSAPEVRDTLAKQGLEASGNTPQQFAAYIAAEVEKWAAVVKASGAKLD
jgi:tripartite-type tricarboxylate transporter receptor subunit TctC